jgi:flagellar protein FlaG
MSNEISSPTTARVSSQLASSHIDHPAAVAKPEVKAPVKAPVQYDPAQMRKNLEEALQRLNEQLQQNSRKLNFSMDPTTKSLVIVVKNSETGEVVRQIPEESVLRVAHHIESLKGLLLNTQS